MDPVQNAFDNTNRVFEGNKKARREIRRSGVSHADVSVYADISVERTLPRIINPSLVLLFLIMIGILQKYLPLEYEVP